jgi:hypothetical protein
MTQSVIIPARFRGPPDSANGGYACGVVARLLEGPAEVTLRRPPPLDSPLSVSRPGRGRVELFDDQGLIAQGHTISDDLSPPPYIDFDAAAAAVSRYRGFEPGATFLSCFVCSPERQDGLRIFPGAIGDTLAAPWTPSSDLAGSDGTVTLEVVWAALDCPTFFASTDPGQLALLGRMAATIEDAVQIGEPHVVVARSSGSDGRKRYGMSAIYAASGDLLATARATWITIEAPGS